MLGRMKNFELGSYICWMPQSDTLFSFQNCANSGRQPQLHLSNMDLRTRPLETGFIWHLQATWNAYICIFCPWHAADTEHSPTATHQSTKSLSPTVCKLQVKDGKWPEIGIGENVYKRLRMRKFTLPATKQINSANRDGRWDRGRTSQSLTVTVIPCSPFGPPGLLHGNDQTQQEMSEGKYIPSKKLLWYHSKIWHDSKVLCFLKYYHEKALQREKILESVHFPLEQKRMLF